MKTMKLPGDFCEGSHLVFDSDAVYAEFEYHGAILIVR